LLSFLWKFKWFIYSLFVFLFLCWSIIYFLLNYCLKSLAVLHYFITIGFQLNCIHTFVVCTFDFAGIHILNDLFHSWSFDGGVIVSIWSIISLYSWLCFLFSFVILFLITMLSACIVLFKNNPFIIFSLNSLCSSMYCRN